MHGRWRRWSLQSCPISRPINSLLSCLVGSDSDLLSTPSADGLSDVTPMSEPFYGYGRSEQSKQLSNRCALRAVCIARLLPALQPESLVRDLDREIVVVSI